MNQQLPERVIVQPTLGPLRPDLEWDDWDQKAQYDETCALLVLLEQSGGEKHED